VSSGRAWLTVCPPHPPGHIVVCELAGEGEGGHTLSHVRPELLVGERDITAAFSPFVATVQFVSPRGLARWVVRLHLFRTFTGSNLDQRQAVVDQGFHGYPQSFQAK
jgi:hypothetical protein